MKRYGYVFLTLCGLAVLAVLYVYPPENLGYDLCPARRLMGVQCAGCGVTRATRALLHGEFRTAFQLNPLYMFFLPFLLYLWFVAGQYAFDAKKPFPLFTRKITGIFLSVLLLFTLLRNIVH